MQRNCNGLTSFEFTPGTDTTRSSHMSSNWYSAPTGIPTRVEYTGGANCRAATAPRVAFARSYDESGYLRCRFS